MRLVAAAAIAILPGCVLWPSRFVDRRVAPPEQVAREAAREPEPGVAAPATPAPPAPAPAPPPSPRSLADLVDLALSRDPATRASWHDARAAAAQAGSRRSLYLPTLDAGVTLLRQQPAAPPAPSGTSPPAPPTQGTLGASASLTWLLLDLGARGALVDEADLLLAAARLAERSAVADLVLRVEQTYFQYLAGLALLEAESSAVKQAEASLAAAEGRQRAGLATVADVLQARTALSQVRLAQQQAEGQALASRGALAVLAGLAPSAELEVGQLPEKVDGARAEPAVDALLAAAAARNPDLGRARAAAEAAAARSRAASLALSPTLSFQASAARTRFLDPSDRDDTYTWSFGLALRIPTIEGTRFAYDALAARENAAAARDRADATGQRVALDVWTSWQSLRTSGRRLGTARDLLDSARASAEVAGGRYREGVGSIVDLLNAQAALELARAEDVRARTDFLVGIAQLARATGRLELPTEGTKGP